jgi:hypothetical protein
MRAARFNKYGLSFRPVEVSDAQFILDLRTNERLGKYISKTESSIDQQIDWILEYKKRENTELEYYYLTEDQFGNSLGLYRLYNFDGNCFEGGSWLYKKAVPPGAPILGDFAIRDIAFEDLKFEFCNLLVRKKNKHVLQYHMSFNPEIIKEDNTDIYLRLSYDNYKMRRDLLLRMLLPKNKL